MFVHSDIQHFVYQKPLRSSSISLLCFPIAEIRLDRSFLHFVVLIIWVT